jgi:tRNA-specific 2-thiouridylase
MTKRVVAAMSGGVDSSVAAARLVDQGYDVVGIHLALAKVKGHAGGKGCCTLDDARDARRVADRLGIPFYIWDVSEEFQREVIENFISEYAEGRTPNPCVRCNEKIKFQAVLERSLALGFDAVATGHYAQIVDTANGPTLHRAIDDKKDQSYVLSVLTPEQLSHTILPLGNSVKPDIRKEAEERGLITAAKPDSHDICFIPDGDTAGFLHKKLGQDPGKIIDVETGEEIGEHDGVFEFTVGQRKGLHLGKPRDDRSRRFVVGTATNLIWCGKAPESQFECTAQVRAHSPALKAKAFHKDGNLTVEFLEPLTGLAPGQTIALYDNTRVIGSGTVVTTTRS